MRMNSDFGKIHRRNYMIKSQLRSLAVKSSELDAKITPETKVDEWAESYVTRADAQIDDVHDYMNYRNLGNLSGPGEYLPTVSGFGDYATMGTLGLLALGIYGFATYNPYSQKGKINKARLQHAGKLAAIGLVGSLAVTGLTQVDQQNLFTKKVKQIVG